jgi:cytochrome P450
MSKSNARHAPRDHPIHFDKPSTFFTDRNFKTGTVSTGPLCALISCYHIASPDLLKVVLQSKIAVIKKDIANTMKPFLTILGTGIVTSEDESWMKQRLKMSNPLRRDVLEIIPRQTLLAVQRLMVTMDQAADSDTKQEIPWFILPHLTLKVISVAVRLPKKDSTFAEMYLHCEQT